jgi:NtrC-family two-component system sensor histidine kinase KinB
VAHELRGPVGVALGALEQIEGELKQVSDSNPRLVQMTRRGLRRVLRTADRLSRAGQLEQGHMTLNGVQLDLRSLLEQACEEAQSLDGRRTVDLKVDLGLTTAPVVADREWLTFALSELVALALRSARSQVRVSLSPAADGWTVGIEDDGSGRSCQPEPSLSIGACSLDVDLVLRLARAIADAQQVAFETRTIREDVQRLSLGFVAAGAPRPL